MEDTENSRNLDAIEPLPIGGTPLSSVLPYPAWSQRSRRRRARLQKPRFHFVITIPLGRTRSVITIPLGRTRSPIVGSPLGRTGSPIVFVGSSLAQTRSPIVFVGTPLGLSRSYPRNQRVNSRGVLPRVIAVS